MAAPYSPPAGSSSRLIDRVPGLRWGRNGGCTFVGAFEAALTVTKRPLDYQTLMGATGLAFRTRWWQGPPETRWCPSSPVGEFKDECDAAGAAAGWNLRAEWDSEPMERLAPAFKDTIDKGIPALAYDAGMNVEVVVGYEDDGRTLLVYDYDHGDEAVRQPTSSLKMFALFLEPAEPALSPYDAALAGIALGVRNFRRRHDPEDDEARGYWHGPLALGKWAEDIGLHDTFTEAERANLFFVSWWNYSALADARRNAGPFLRAAMPLFPSAAWEHLDCAASLYETEAEILARPFGAKDAFLGPWSGKTIADWQPAVRETEVRLLSDAIRIEMDAVPSLEAILAAA